MYLFLKGIGVKVVIGRDMQPSRLREARQVRKYSYQKLSEVSGLQEARLRGYEAGTIVAFNKDIERLAEVLKVPREYFSLELPFIEPASVRHRSLRSIDSLGRQALNVRLSWVVRLFEGAQRAFNVSSVAFDELESIGDLASIGPAKIETMAMAVRRLLGKEGGAFGRVIYWMERLGAVVARTYISEVELPSCSVWVGGRPFVLLNSDMPESSVRLAAAHELGHIVLHRNVGPVAGRAHRLMEEQARLFAMAFVMPERYFQREIAVETREDLLGLKKAWKIPLPTILERARRRGCISRQSYQKALDSAARSCQGGLEWGEEAIPTEEPHLLPGTYTQLLGERGSGASLEDFTAVMGLPVAEAAELLGLSSKKREVEKLIEFKGPTKAQPPQGIETANVSTNDGQLSLFKASDFE